VTLSKITFAGFVFDISQPAPLANALVRELSKHGLGEAFRGGCDALHKLIDTDNKAEELLLAPPTLVESVEAMIANAAPGDACKASATKLPSRFTDAVQLRVSRQHN